MSYKSEMRLQFHPATDPPINAGTVLIRDELMYEYRVAFFDPECGDDWWWLGRSKHVDSLSWAALPEMESK